MPRLVQSTSFVKITSYWVFGQEVGCCTVPLDGTRASNRTQETNLGNWVADVWRLQTAADVALLNAGSLKIDEARPFPSTSLPLFHHLGGLYECAVSVAHTHRRD